MDMKQYEKELSISSTQNGTIQNHYFLAAIKNRLYLCGAFERQVHEFEY